MPSIRLAVDRFEGRDEQIAVLVADDGRVLNFPRGLLPAGTRGGEVLALAIVPDAGPSGSSAGVDVNAAPADELRALPGVGPVLAERLVAGRPYKDVDELARVEGLGAAKLERLRPLVAAGPTPGGAPAPIRLRVERPADGPGGDARLATDDGREVVLPGDLLPGPVGAGEGLTLALERDTESTRQVAEETRSIQEQLRSRDPGGDLKL
ncbi:helix-hairpin-helix domain-containing protein [Tautonia plasticadhaerens]|uniref:Photosystem II complex extrinsic protein U n=1 Tax=Tautonia plasticadhaerens TaxID=2527974 RepID=A0A518HEY1_9BACT|nr:helix-hairpin-helix domain-containing protein [Tautonia plasticadhaerens]QDV39391.1 photosystem II complex extrinsic protein precursor U [Tautonia plasticadhaerens]